MEQTTASEKAQTTANGKRWSPPRGVRLFRLGNRPDRPFAVQWRVEGRRQTKTFKSASGQLDFARSLAGSAEKFGVSAYRLDEDEARIWRAFKAQIGDASLDDVLACWLRHSKADQSSQMTVREAVPLFLAAKEAEGIAESSLAHYRPVFDRLTAAMGNSRASAVTREQVATWVAAVPGADYSRRTHLVRARGLFQWLKINRYLTESPCDGVKPVRITPDEVAILTVEQARTLFAKNESDRELCGRLALEAFAGLRFTSAAQITPFDIAFDSQGIQIPAAKIKTRRREFIDGLTANLWAWLRWSKPDTWAMTPRVYLQRKSEAFIRADIPHPRNALRHSFCTYDIAKHKDAARTAVTLCHASPKTLYRHYKGRATEADGVAYFTILPPKKNP
jgi:site-specific recombinase XerD